MTYDARETSVYQGEPYELYLFQTETQSWRMTSADREITFGGEVYLPTAIHRTETSQGQENKSGAVKLTIPKDHSIAGLFISFIPSTPMSLVIYRGHEGESEDEVVTHFTGGVSSALFTDTCELTAIPESEILKRRVPVSVYQAQCNHMLYDRGCTIDKDDFRTDTTLTDITGDTVQSADFAGEDDGWFDAGYIEKGTERRMIIRHVGNTLTLLNPMAGLLTGDEVTAYAGCMRSSAVCIAKFDNIVNFLGFEFIPTRNPFGKAGLT